MYYKIYIILSPQLEHSFTSLLSRIQPASFGPNVMVTKQRNTIRFHDGAAYTSTFCLKLSSLFRSHQCNTKEKS